MLCKKIKYYHYFQFELDFALMHIQKYELSRKQFLLFMLLGFYTETQLISESCTKTCKL